MTTQTQNCAMKGFMLLPPSPVKRYRGVDRQPFEPLLLEEDLSAQVEKDDNRIWVHYPPGWRREAYRIYEENSAIAIEEDLILLTNLKASREIKKIIEPHLGVYEIVICEVWSLNSVSLHGKDILANNLGFDIAYPGGDFYSAILNGLLVNSHPTLVEEFGSLINDFGLFASTAPIPDYVTRFRELVLSEADSEFVIFNLGKAMSDLVVAR